MKISEKWLGQVLLLGVLASAAPSAMACWTCADLPYLAAIEQSLEQMNASIGGGISDPLAGTVNGNLMDIKGALNAINKSVGDVTKESSAQQALDNKAKVTHEVASDQVNSLIYHKPTLEGCISLTNSLPMAASHAAAEGAKNTYAREGMRRTIHPPEPASVAIDQQINENKPFCTPAMVAAEAGSAGVHQCLPINASSLPGASLMSLSLSAGMVNAPPSDLSSKANESIGSTVSTSPGMLGNKYQLVPSGMAVNQAKAAATFVTNIQGPGLPEQIDPQAMDTPGGKEYAPYWDAFTSRMSTLVEALSSISGSRTVEMQDQGPGKDPLPPQPDVKWKTNKETWEQVFPGQSFPDTPSEMERIRFEVYRRTSGVDFKSPTTNMVVRSWQTALPAPVSQLATTEAWQLQLSLIQVVRIEENNKLLAALLAQSLNPVTKDTVESMSKSVARGRSANPVK